MQESENKILHVGVLLNRFKNGRERYFYDPVFQKVVDALARGTDPIIIIDDLCRFLADTTDKYKDYVTNGPPPQYIVADKETIDKLKNNSSL